MAIDLNLAMVTMLVEKGYDQESAEKIWQDVCEVRAAFRLKIHTDRKFKKVIFVHSGVKFSATIHDVRVTEDKGIEYQLDTGEQKVWVSQNNVYDK